jgi:hypothetical protein
MWNFLLRQGVNIAPSTTLERRLGRCTEPGDHRAGVHHYDLRKPGADHQRADVYYQMKLYYTGPARRAGESIMLKDAANLLQQPRRAWQYLPGQRRVKLAPNLAYDTPNPGTAGAGADDVFVFNGALDRYDWKLVGKQEMIVPYNTYKLTYAQDPKSLTTPNHLAPISCAGRNTACGWSRATSRPAHAMSTRSVASTWMKTAGPLWPPTNTTHGVSSTVAPLPSSARAMTSKCRTPRPS